MKVLSIVAICAFGFNAIAADEEFAMRKQKKLENMDKMISQMQQSRTCVSAATNKDEMKKCKEKMKEHMKGMREEHKEMKKDWSKKKEEKKN